ncbi:MAG: hypothetical protein K8F52_03715 [Candidatus Scalindua rubra]|uniref:Uncharacterized protein n=1 Tax=Candidatus Scalindua brodae TaxID=237368 RepID=A0A0B0EQV4_9BACT|nr:MAG: hypothetical protein SCABRO_00694 [Candidatus Scalindua brodae]MBZ0107754.1 hypothetical protein [Candidatus Scalindua rubra]
MQTVQKEKVYGYAFKAVLSLILFFCLYNAVCIFFLSPYSGRKLRSRVSSAVDAVEIIIKHAGPKKTENVIYKSNLVNKTRDSSWANQIKRATLFAGPTARRLVKAEKEIVQYEKVEETDSTEIIFKGMAGDVAYINIKKEIDGQWREYGFPTKVGEKIGNKKVVGGETLDFTTNYILQDIVYDAQRPVALNKKIVDLNEAGEFVGTRIVPGETYMKSTSRIKYKNENGNISELWLNDSGRITRAEEERLSENIE